MRPLAEAAIRAGLIDPEVLTQFKKWGLVPKDIEPVGASNPEEIVEELQEALESEDQVRLQTTDLDLLKYYLTPENQQRGQIVLVHPETHQRATRTVVFAVRSLYGRDQYILPWMSDTVADMLTNGNSYLRWVPPGAASKRIYLIEHDKIYLGDVESFLVCIGVDHDSDE
jgi:hypothetical protein